MHKKKKDNPKNQIIILILLIIVSIIGIFCYQQKKYENKIEYQYQILGSIYGAMYSPNWKPSTEKSFEEKKILVNNPPPLEMNGLNGLYMRSQSYYYSTGKKIDCEDVQKILGEGRIEELYEKYQEYFSWYSMNSFLSSSYSTAILNISVTYDNKFLTANEKYEVYQEVIEYHQNEIEKIMTDWGYPKYVDINKS